MFLRQAQYSPETAPFVVDAGGLFCDHEHRVIAAFLCLFQEPNPLPIPVAIPRRFGRGHMRIDDIPGTVTPLTFGQDPPDFIGTIAAITGGSSLLSDDFCLFPPPQGLRCDTQKSLLPCLWICILPFLWFTIQKHGKTRNRVGSRTVRFEGFCPNELEVEPTSPCAMTSPGARMRGSPPRGAEPGIMPRDRRPVSS